MASGVPYPSPSEHVPRCRMPARRARRKPGTPVGSPAGDRWRSAIPPDSHSPAGIPLHGKPAHRPCTRPYPEGGRVFRHRFFMLLHGPWTGGRGTLRSTFSGREEVPVQVAPSLLNESCATSRAHPRKGKPPPCCSTCTCSSVCRCRRPRASLRRRHLVPGVAPGARHPRRAGRLPGAVTTRAGRPAREPGGSGGRHGPCSG
jgi:hypothetical protein